MLDVSKYDFIDFGSGFGGCIAFAKQKLGGRKALGFEKHAGRCNDLRAKGYSCVNADVTKLALPKNSVSFVTMSHVLEHLHSKEEVEKTIKLAVDTAKDFVFIEGPSFDFDEYLNKFNLKFSWRDGHGHATKVTVSDVITYTAELPIVGYTLLVEHPLIMNSLSKDIHPIDSPPSVHDYNPKKHSPKEYINFNPPIYRSFIIFLWLHHNLNIQKYVTSRFKFRRRLEKWLK
jgi:hypothetical protein